jgi:hypothetical protein
MAEQALAASANLLIMHSLDEQIGILEQAIKVHIKPSREMAYLKGVAGIGDILGWTLSSIICLNTHASKRT